jgi:hypothetical protein
MIWLSVAAVASTIGCGDGRPQRVPVAGTVLIDGKPLTYGFVTFFPAEGRSATGQINKQGEFILSSYEQGDGTLAGSQQVAIMTREAISPTQAKWHAPKKYAKHETSGIVIEIAGPTDDLQIDLSWGGEKPSIETDS